MAKAPAAEAKDEAKPICGIIMPIAAMPPKYDASHWIDVRRVIDAAIIKADMTPQIVSDSFEGDVIQRRIISNLYDNPVVVCDVSGLNPNVMFELGMRITFKQPVIIITDDFATIPFDTKVIEHLGYPRDLHIHQTNEFIDKLADRIMRLHDQKKEKTFKSFIEEFGTFEVLEPTKKVVEADQMILDRLESMERSLSRISTRTPLRKRFEEFSSRPGGPLGEELRFELEAGVNGNEMYALNNVILETFGPHTSVARKKNGDGSITIVLGINRADVEDPSVFINECFAKMPLQFQSKIKSISWG